MIATGRVMAAERVERLPIPLTPTLNHIAVHPNLRQCVMSIV